MLKCWGGTGWASSTNSVYWGCLGSGDTENRGDDDGEMGDNLDAVQLPDAFVADQVVAHGHVTCVLSTAGEVVCFGQNNYGQCGVGHSDNIGDDANEMGNDLVAVDLGLGFDIAQLSGGSNVWCAVSSMGEMKCWGRNDIAALGLGDTDNRGDEPNEMGDYLPIIDIGTAFYVEKVRCGAHHCCALSTDTDFKCWGSNAEGAAGYEDGSTRGDEADEMGDFLMSASLGTDFVVADFTINGLATYVLSTSGEIKSFGRGSILGYGDSSNRGDTAGSMGDALPVVDIGSGFTGDGLRLSEPYGDGQYVCVFEESTDLLLKCFGMGWKYGQLGYGDIENRGDEPNEMGDFLPFVDLHFTFIPEPVCDEDEMYAVDWHNLLNEDEEDSVLLHNYTVAFDASSLSLTLSATVEYVGLSADGNFDDELNLGTTYWIDLESFSSVDGGVDSAGTCANRQSADYGALDFEDFFGFTTNPMDLESASTEDRMAYPPSDWTLTASSCNVVKYERTFSWADLTECANAAGNGLVSVTETDDSVLLEGTFFVELVSPYSMSSDEYYRTLPLVQQDFAIALSRTVNVLSSTNTQLFITSVMGWGEDDDGNHQVTVLIQSADFVQLLIDDLSIISVPDGLTVSGVEAVSSDCLVASSFTCGQIFTATIPDVCSETLDDGSSVDLGGIFQFAFSPECRTLDDGTTNEACETFMDTLDGTDGKVVLDVDASSFLINCNMSLFEVAFDAEMTFYSDDAFTVEVVDGSDPFVIGQDTIYGKVSVDIPADIGIAFADVEIEAVYVCTAEDAALLSLDSDTGLGGCLSSYIDADGPYKVIGSDAVSALQGNNTYSVVADNEAAFSFLTFDTPRETINVHVQILVTMETESGERRRRRMLLQSNDDESEGNSFQSYIGTASVQEADTTDAPLETDGAATFSVGFMPAMFAVIGCLMMD
jgi:hypothetical protein